MKKALKQDILESIKNDPLLFGQVASAAGVSPFSMPRLIKNNSYRFTREPVLKVLRKATGLQDKNILTELTTTI